MTGHVLGGVPVQDLRLALAQAAGMLAETRMPVAEYLGLLDEAPAEVLGEGVPISLPAVAARRARPAHRYRSRAQLLSLCA